MIKRIMLWFAMNAAIMIIITAIFFILEHVFWITLDLYGTWSSSIIPILIFSTIVWFTWSFISLAISKWMAKRAYKITPITIEQVSSLSEKERLVWDLVSELSERNHITMPEVGIYQSNEANAFATGMSKNSSLVAVSTELLDIMDKKAIEWVVAHEMTHILNGDMVTMALLQWVLNTFVVFFARIVANIIASRLDEWLGGIAYFIVNILLQIVFGILASLLAMKFSRYREFKADAWSAKYVWKEKMIAWLQALKNIQSKISWDEWNLATMKISTKKTSWFMMLFSSHPDLDERIKRLENMIIN